MFCVRSGVTDAALGAEEGTRVQPEDEIQGG